MSSDETTLDGQFATDHTADDLRPTWLGLVDDAAIFPPGNAGIHEATAAFGDRRERWYADFVGSFVLKDTDLPLVRGFDAPLSIVVTGGAGQISGSLGLARKLGMRAATVEIALRDHDDLPGNARRVVAALDEARGDGLLEEDPHVYVELPQEHPSAGWLRAADEVAASELRLKFRTGGIESHLFPSAEQLAAWVDAALDRETPFKCTAGLHDALRHTDPETGFEHHGFLNLMLATIEAFDGAAPDAVTARLDQRDATALVADARDTDLTRARRWFTSFGSCSVTEPLESLINTGLLEDK